MRKLSADGEAKTRPAVLPARARVGLLEGLENNLLLLLRYADARVGYLESRDHWRLTQDRMIGVPAIIYRGNLEPHTALLREFEGIRKKVLEHLLDALRIGRNTPAKAWVDLHVEGKPSRFCFMPEG